MVDLCHCIMYTIHILIFKGLNMQEQIEKFKHKIEGLNRKIANDNLLTHWKDKDETKGIKNAGESIKQLNEQYDTLLTQAGKDENLQLIKQLNNIKQNELFNLSTGLTDQSIKLFHIKFGKMNQSIKGRVYDDAALRKELDTMDEIRHTLIAGLEEMGKVYKEKLKQATKKAEPAKTAAKKARADAKKATAKAEAEKTAGAEKKGFFQAMAGAAAQALKSTVKASGKDEEEPLSEEEKRISDLLKDVEDNICKLILLSNLPLFYFALNCNTVTKDVGRLQEEKSRKPYMIQNLLDKIKRLKKTEMNLNSFSTEFVKAVPNHGIVTFDEIARSRPCISAAYLTELTKLEGQLNELKVEQSEGQKKKI
jgi:hypothetical protein